MSERIYLDTNVWLDYYWNRQSKYLDQGAIAHRILVRTIECEFTLIISDILLAELEQFVDNIQSLIEPLKEKCVFVRASRSSHIQAKQLPLHYPDSVHMILAQEHQASCFVTNDKGITSKTLRVVQSPAL